MTWQQAKETVEAHLQRWHVPCRLDGVLVQITEYDDEDTLRFLKTEEPEITLQSQRMINQAFEREVRKRGARVQFVPMNISNYFSWLGQFDLKDNNHMRAQYIAWVTAPEPKPTPTQK